MDCKEKVPKNNVFLNISEHPSFMNYAEGVTKTGMVLANVGQQGIKEVTQRVLKEVKSGKVEVFHL